jgi:hypothetical protein
MKISEITTPPGYTPTLNTGAPSTFPPNGPSANLAAQMPTSNYTSLTNTSNNTNPQNNPQAATNLANQKPVAPVTPTNDPAIAQKLTKGGKLQLPVGPNKKLTQFNITNVAPNKDVTLNDPRNPNQPGQTYKSAQLANLLSGNNGNI